MFAITWFFFELKHKKCMVGTVPVHLGWFELVGCYYKLACHAAPTCSFGRNPPTSRRVGGMSPTCWRHNLLREIPFLFWFWHPTYRLLLQFPILPWHLRHQRGVPSWLQVHWNPLTLSFEVASFVCCCLLSSNDKVHRGLLDERRPITPWFSSLSTINTTLTLPRPPSTSHHDLCCLFLFSNESS